ncbi:MAG: DUF2249 domain-containing protein [Usitatibacter sp.]
MPGNPEVVVDLRDLDPPEPMVRILDALGSQSQERFSFLLSREPRPLYALLAASGWRHELRRDARGFELTVFRQKR